MFSFFFEILICKFVLPFGFNKYEYSFIKKKKKKKTDQSY